MTARAAGLRRRALLGIPLLVATLYAFRTTILSAGVPDFRHDWWWPFRADSIHAAFPDVLSVWNSAGLGSPRYEVVDHPALWLVHILSAALSSKAVLVVGIVAAVYLTGAGVVVLARRLEVGMPLALAAGIVATLGAPTFNKFVAGHWYYAIAIAAMPWAIAGAVRYRGRDVPRALAVGAIVALTGLQPQIWVVTTIVCVAVLTFGPDRRDARTAIDIVAMLAAGSVLVLPEVYGVVAAHSVAGFADMQTIPMWEANNSAAFSHAVVGLGYAPGYAERAVGFVPWAVFLLWTVPLSAMLGLALRRSDRVVGILGIAWLLALGLVIGVDGPLARPLGYLYAHFLWASAFRELYHFAEPMWIFATVLAVVGLDRLRPAIGRTVAFAGVIGVLALWAPPGYAGTLRSWDFADRAASLVGTVPLVPSRYLLTPSIQPLGPRGSPYAGVDPDANLHGVWYPLNAAGQSGVVGATLLLGERDPVRYAGWLRAADVNAVLPRPYLASSAIEGSALDPDEKRQAERYFGHPGRSIAWREAPRPFVEVRTDLPVLRDPFTQRFDDGFVLERDVLTDPHDPDAVAADRRTSPAVARSAWNPARNWVRGIYWWWLDPQVAFWPHAALTWSDTALPVPAAYRRDGYAHAIVFAGTLYVGGRAVRAPHGIATWVPLRGAGELRVLRGAAMVIEFADVERPLHLARRDAGADAAGAPVAFDPGCLCASMHIARARSWVVLKQSYDDDWRLQVKGGTVLRHVLFAGYGNAWEVRAAPGSEAYLSYAPAAPWQALVDGSLIAWVLVAAGGAIALWSR